jgi:hypothetical protein
MTTLDIQFLSTRSRRCIPNPHFDESSLRRLPKHSSNNTTVELCSASHRNDHVHQPETQHGTALGFAMRTQMHPNWRATSNFCRVSVQSFRMFVQSFAGSCSTCRPSAQLASTITLLDLATLQSRPLHTSIECGGSPMVGSVQTGASASTPCLDRFKPTAVFDPPYSGQPCTLHTSGSDAPDRRQSY